LRPKGTHPLRGGESSPIGRSATIAEHRVLLKRDFDLVVMAKIQYLARTLERTTDPVYSA
jgi:hypothetical protein